MIEDPYEKAELIEEALEWLARQYFDEGALPVMGACSKISVEHGLPEDWLFVLVLARVEEIEAMISFLHDELSQDSARWN